MPFRSPRERRLWTFAAGYTLLIYSTLGVVRPVTEWLRARNLLQGVIVLAFASAVILLLRRVLADRPGAREWAVLIGAALGYAAILPFAVRPEEQIHLLEYGLLGGVSYLALLERARPAPGGTGEGRPGAALRSAAVGAFLLTAALGWIDEAIQGILPNRFYDLRDVAFNAVSGGLAVAGLAGRAWARKRRPGSLPAALRPEAQG